MFVCTFITTAAFFGVINDDDDDDDDNKNKKQLKSVNICSELSAKRPRVRSTVTKRTGVLTLNKLCGRPPQYAPAHCKLTLKVVSESRMTWATSVPILVFTGLSVLDLGPMYATDTDVRQTDRCQTASSLNAPA